MLFLKRRCQTTFLLSYLLKLHFTWYGIWEVGIWEVGEFLLHFSLETIVFLMHFFILNLFISQQEYLENGPLFSELKFYQRAAKLEHSK